MSPEEDRSVCSPCRGTGKVIANLGRGPHEVKCPWCGGGGRFEAGRDAQAAAPDAGDGAAPDAGDGEPAAQER